MAWTITTGKRSQDPKTLNWSIPVTATEEGTGRVLTRTFGPAITLTADYVREQVKAWLQSVADSDATGESLATIEEKTITVKDPAPVDPDLEAFRLNWRRLKKLLTLQSTTPGTVTKIGQLRTAIETALTAHPTWIDDIGAG